MKKTSILVFLIIMQFTTYAQQNIPSKKGIAKFTKSKHFKTQQRTIPKEAGDIIWSDDFSNPSNWTMQALQGTENWNIAPINDSENAENLEYSGTNNLFEGNIAFYNAMQYILNPQNPFPEIVEATLTLNNPIDLSADSNIVISWDQISRAFNFDQVFLEYSLNGTDWLMYGGGELFANTAINSWSTETPRYNVSTEIGGQSSVYLRFRFFSDESVDVAPENYGAGYGWMIDNIRITKSATNDIVLEKLYIDFFEPNSGCYNKIPVSINYYGSIGFHGAVHNIGTANQTGVNFGVVITKENGGVVYDKVGDSKDIISNERDTLQLGVNLYSDPENPILTDSAYGEFYGYGLYSINATINSDSIDEIPSNNIGQYSFEITHDLYARDNGIATGSVSPAKWESGGTDGDVIGVKYHINNPVEVSSMAVFIDSNSAIGSSIIGKIMIDNGGGSIVEVLSTSESYDIVTSDLGNWIILDFPANGSSELIEPEEGENSINCYAVIEIYYNGHNTENDMFLIGEDTVTQNSSQATIWNFAENPEYLTLSNYSGTPMIDLILTGNPTPPPWGPQISMSILNSSDFIYQYGQGPSQSEFCNISARNLWSESGSISVNAPENFEVSINDTNYFSSINFDYFSTQVTKTVYVRLKTGLDIGTYNGYFTTTSSEGGYWNDFCQGEVTPFVSINETDINEKVKIYPNPTKGIIYIDGITNVNLNIYNVLGEKVYNKVNNENTNKQQIDVSNLPKGIYFIDVDGIAKEKFILE